MAQIVTSWIVSPASLQETESICSCSGSVAFQAPTLPISPCQGPSSWLPGPTPSCKHGCQRGLHGLILCHQSPACRLCAQLSLCACTTFAVPITLQMCVQTIAAPTHHIVVCAYQLGDGVLLSQPKSWTCCHLHSSGLSCSRCGMGPNLQIQHPTPPSQANKTMLHQSDEGVQMSCCCSDCGKGACTSGWLPYTLANLMYMHRSPETGAVLYDGLALHMQQECGVCACMDAGLVALNHKHTVLHTCVSFPLLLETLVYYVMLSSATSSHSAALR